MVANVFISYSHVDSEVVKGIESVLQDIGIGYFLDEKDIEWGDPITNDVHKAIKSCSAMIVVVSPASLKSHWVPYEVGQAAALGKKILPFVTHPSLDVPSFIQDLNYASNLDEVRNYLKNVYKKDAEPTTLREIDGKKLSPKERDDVRTKRNNRIKETLMAHTGITKCAIFQLEDHTDKGYAMLVKFDDSISAANVLSTIREAFSTLFPKIPIWGEVKEETENSIVFAYTWIDPYNKAFLK